MPGETPFNPGESASQEPTREAEHAPVERVAVIDDEPQLLRLTARLLGRASGGAARVSSYETAGAALAGLSSIAAEQPADLPQVIVTDRDLDGANKGEDLIAQIRALSPELAAVRFIGMSGNPDGAELLAKAGAEKVLAKPFPLDSFDYLFKKKSEA